jgi:hypothetical protein
MPATLDIAARPKALLGMAGPIFRRDFRKILALSLIDPAERAIFAHLARSPHFPAARFLTHGAIAGISTALHD